MRASYVFDLRIDYNPKKKPKYRYKNVEIQFTIDFYISDKFIERLERLNENVDVYEALYNAVGSVAQVMSKIFISETNFIQFPEDYIIGYPEGFEESNYEDTNTYVEVEYTDYGTDTSRVHIVKAFSDIIKVPYHIFMFAVIYYLYKNTTLLYMLNNARVELLFKKFVRYMRSAFGKVISLNLSGSPGRKRKGE